MIMDLLMLYAERKNEKIKVEIVPLQLLPPQLPLILVRPYNFCSVPMCYFEIVNIAINNVKWGHVSAYTRRYDTRSLSDEYVKMPAAQNSLFNAAVFEINIIFTIGFFTSPNRCKYIGWGWVQV